MQSQNKNDQSRIAPLILIADQDLNRLKVTASLLRNSGYHVATTPTSDRVIDLVQKSNPDMIILEIDLKGMDGLETCRFLREKLGVETPILIQSKLNSEDIILKAFESGANEYLVKPTPEGILKAKIKLLLTKSNQIRQQDDAIAEIPATEETYLGDYKIIQKIGGGSTANVYKAVSRTTNEMVAIKVLNQQAVGNSKDIQRFFRGSLIGLEMPPHPNIVQIYEIKKTEQYIYQVMEYVEGQTLFQIIKSGHLLTESEVICVILDICSALEHLHQNQVLHRDVKPGNIFVRSNWSCKLGDMGISRRIVDRAATSAGHIVGTPGYIAPEQILDMRPIDIRIDIYALGLTVFHALTGANPLDRETAYASILARIEGPELQMPPEAAPHVSKEICSIVSKMIRRLPADRYDSPSAIINVVKIFNEFKK